MKIYYLNSYNFSRPSRTSFLWSTVTRCIGARAMNWAQEHRASPGVTQVIDIMIGIQSTFKTLHIWPSLLQYYNHRSLGVIAVLTYNFSDRQWMPPPPTPYTNYYEAVWNRWHLKCRSSNSGILNVNHRKLNNELFLNYWWFIFILRKSQTFQCTMYTFRYHDVYTFLLENILAITNLTSFLLRMWDK